MRSLSLQRFFATAIFLIACCSPTFLRAQDEQRKVEEMAKIYGFYIGQQYTVDHIKTNFPSFAPRLDHAVAEWEKKFYPSIEHVTTYLGKTYPIEFKELNEALTTAVADQLKARVDEINDSNVENVVAEIEDRGNGTLPSTFIELFLKYHPKYSNNPMQEYSDKYVQVYESDGSGRAKGLKVSFNVPASWKKGESEEADFFVKYSSIDDNVVQFSCSVVDAESLKVDVSKGGTVESQLKNELNEKFADKLAKDLGGKKATKVKNLTVDNRRSLSFISDISIDVGGKKNDLTGFICITLYENYMIYFTMFGDYSKKDKKSVSEENVYQLFNTMLKDIVFVR